MLFLVLALMLPLQKATPAQQLKEAVATGKLAWSLSDPEELRSLLGNPDGQEVHPDGGMEKLLVKYGKMRVTFVRQREPPSPWILVGAEEGTERIGAHPNQALKLRKASDLTRLPPFTGLQNVDASQVDLRPEGIRLRDLPFDTQTRWPSVNRLPEGFDPKAILEAGRNPGLGIRALHAQGVDGQGVEIAIVDQPLVPDHTETLGRLHILEEIDVVGVSPQMHGPMVASLAVGRSCGVAPGSKLHYVSVAMWKSQVGNQYMLRALERILELNRKGQARIRVVSISTGMFRHYEDYSAWKTLLKKAEAEGVLVITCDLEDTQLDYGLLCPLPGGDRERPEGYQKGRYGKGLRVPAEGRTFASPWGPTEFSYSPEGGMSEAAPWLAGLAALGLQVNPGLTPAQIREYLVITAQDMPYGKVPHPKAFIERCRKDRLDRE